MKKLTNGELSFLFAIPIPGPSLELHRFVVDRFMELGDSSGLAVWWRPIASPRLADPIYKSLRSPSQIRSDEVRALQYDSLSEEAGGEDIYVRSQYYELSRRYNIGDAHRPAVVFEPRPYNGLVKILHLPPSAFETRERRRALECFLYQELGAKRIAQFSQNNTYTDLSMARLQGHLDKICAFVANSIVRDKGIPPKMWSNYLAHAGLVVRPDPVLYTSARAWRDRGNLYLETETEGKKDGRAVFPLFMGAVTKQMSMMWRLLLAWPHGVSYSDLARELYTDDFEAGLLELEPRTLESIARRLRALVHDIRADRLERAGVHPGILPTIATNSNSNAILQLQLAKLDRDKLGHLAGPRE